MRSYIAEPDRGRRHWTKTPEAQAPVYGNRRRVRGARGQRLMRRRGEYVERSFAHVYDTGGLRRTHLRGHQNILKRLLVHAGAFNLGLLMRQAFGRGTPRGLQGRRFDLGALEIAFGTLVERVWTAGTRLWAIPGPTPGVVRTLIQRSASLGEVPHFHHGLLRDGRSFRASTGTPTSTARSTETSLHHPK